MYIEYENSTRLVVEIHETMPIKVRDNHSIAISDQWHVGMELEYVITVDTVDQDNRVTASSTTKQTVPAYQLLKKYDEVKNENENLKKENQILKAQNNALAERADFIEDIIAEIAMQVYQ